LHDSRHGDILGGHILAVALRVIIVVFISRLKRIVFLEGLVLRNGIAQGQDAGTIHSIGRAAAGAEI